MGHSAGNVGFKIRLPNANLRFGFSAVCNKSDTCLVSLREVLDGPRSLHALVQSLQPCPLKTFRFQKQWLQAHLSVRISDPYNAHAQVSPHPKAVEPCAAAQYTARIQADCLPRESSGLTCTFFFGLV